MICKQGDIIMVDFEPTRGHEPNKFRPAVVLSADDFNLRSSLTVVAPITSHDNGYPMHIPLNASETQGFICLEQLRSIDLTIRKCRHIDIAKPDTMTQVLSYTAAIFGL